MQIIILFIIQFNKRWRKFMSKKNEMLIKLLMLALVLAVGLITSCDMQGIQEMQDSEAASSSRSAGRVNNQKSFTADVTVFQADRGEMSGGAGDRYRTTGEILTGSIESEDWEAVNGSITMENFTNFHLTPVGYREFPLTGDMAPYYEISGANHSKEITITSDSLGDITLKANGTIEGGVFGLGYDEAGAPVLYGSAQLDMNCVSVGPGPNIRGNLTGEFSWYGCWGYPSGTFTIDGFYK